MSIKMSPSERGDSISPQGSANACENINGGIFKFEQENMEKIQDELWQIWPKWQKPELTLKRKWLILKIFLFIYFGFFSIKIYLIYLKYLYIF